MKKFGLSKSILKFIYKFISLRHLYIRYGEIDEYSGTDRKVTQGGALSPLLEGLYQGEVNDIEDYDCKILQFAEDIAIYIKTCLYKILLT